jgi:hypothetical protein
VLLPVGTGAPGRAGAARRSLREDLPAGLAHIRRRPALALGVTAMVAGQCLTRATDSMTGPVFKELGVDEAGLGVLLTGLGAGYVVGAIAVGQWGKRFDPLRTLGLATAVAGAVLAAQGAVLLLGGRAPALVWVAPAALLGVAYAALGVSYGYIVQRETPADLMGRVSATAGSLTTALPLAAPPLVAVLVEWVGLGPVYTTAAVATAVLGAGVALLRPRRATAAAEGTGAVVPSPVERSGGPSSVPPRHAPATSYSGAGRTG